MTAWEKCVAYHGHICGGINIGYRAALYVMDLLDVDESDPADLCCLAENNTCCVDAFRVLLGCTEENGNLRFRLTDQQAFSFCCRSTGESLRLVLRPMPQGMSKEQAFRYIQDANEEDLFDIGPVDEQDLELLKN